MVISLSPSVAPPVRPFVKSFHARLMTNGREAVKNDRAVQEMVGK